MCMFLQGACICSLVPINTTEVYCTHVYNVHVHIHVRVCIQKMAIVHVHVQECTHDINYGGAE